MPVVVLVDLDHVAVVDEVIFGLLGADSLDDPDLPAAPTSVRPKTRAIPFAWAFSRVEPVNVGMLNKKYTF